MADEQKQEGQVKLPVNNGTLKLILVVVALLFGSAGGGYVGTSRGNGNAELRERVARIEADMGEVKERQRIIEQDVKELLKRVPER